MAEQTNPDWAIRNARAVVESSSGSTLVWITRVTGTGHVVTNYKGETRFTKAHLRTADDGTQTYCKKTDKGELVLRQPAT